MSETELLTRVARLRHEATELAATEVGTLDVVQATHAHGELRAATDKLRALAARLLSVVEMDGRLAGGDARTVAEAVARREGTSVGSARHELAVGRALEEQLPGTRAAVADGSITFEHAQVLSRLGPTSEARRAALAGALPDRNEAFLLAAARTTPVDAFRREVRRWASRVDGQAAEREHALATAREHLTVSRRDDGVAVQGFLTAENGALLTTALRAVTGVPAADDERTPEQRAAGALVGLARTVLDRGLAGSGAQVRPHLSVHVAWETMQALEHPEAVPDPAALSPAELETGEPLPTTVLGRLLCDSELTRIVFGPAGEVLDVGRARRTYTHHLRRAVVARDRTCRYPGCEAPPVLGEIHHVVPWSHGGPTSVPNGILLCWHHHDLVHRRGLRITRDASGWAFARDDGTPITAPRGSPPPRALGTPITAPRGSPPPRGGSPPPRVLGGPPDGAPDGASRDAVRTPSSPVAIPRRPGASPSGRPGVRFGSSTTAPVAARERSGSQEAFAGL